MENAEIEWKKREIEREETDRVRKRKKEGVRGEGRKEKLGVELEVGIELEFDDKKRQIFFSRIVV